MALPYATLDSNQRQIRLLQIIPDENEQNIVRGSLHTVSLLDKPKYEALSYVWGDTNFRKDVIIDNCVVSVTSTLAELLRCLRNTRQEDHQVVWCDYICINQNSIEERNEQVLIMGEIYRESDLVIAWLGDLTLNIKQAVAYYDAKAGKATPDNEYWYTLKSNYPASWKDVCRMEDNMIQVWKGVGEITSSPYWHRLWTAQEWYMPTEKPLCMCGSVIFEMWDLVQAFSEFRKWANSCGSQVAESASRESNEQDVTRITIDLINVIVGITEKLDTKILLAIHRFERIQRFLTDNKTIPMSVLLFITKDRQCSVLVDKVFALYSMAPLIRQRFPPDYHKTVDQVFHETTTYAVEEKNDTCGVFDVFSFYNKPSIPSWVLDFSTPPLKSSEKILHYDPFEFTMKFDEVPCLPEDGSKEAVVIENNSTLSLSAKLVGTIYNHERLPNKDAHLAITKRYNDMQNSISLALDTSQTSSEMFLAACYEYIELAHGSYKLSRNKFFQTIQDPTSQKHESKRDEIATIVENCLGGMGTFFVDDGNGTLLIGVEAGGAENGDIVAIPKRGRVGWVLRADEESSANSTGVCERSYFKIINRAHIHGVLRSKDPTDTKLLTNSVYESAWVDILIR